MLSDLSVDIPTVFISYAHEGSLGEKVAALADWLTEHGVQVITDHPYHNHPPRIGWLAWMQHSIEDASLVLIVCSPRYKNLFEKRGVEDNGGAGVTWESAIITSDLYHSRLNNQRFFPILPDDGDNSHIPSLLTDWNNNHRFPTGNQRILSLICDEVKIPTPKRLIQRLLPGELAGSNDPRLQPREGDVFGREHEIEEILAFLSGENGSATVCEYVVRCPGIGKTEVCKAALKRWLNHDSATRSFWIQVSDDADTLRLLGQIGAAVGLKPEEIALIRDVTLLSPFLPGGLYYLDNLDSIVETPDGKHLLRELSQFPGIRFLASSRVNLDSVPGNSIFIDRLDIDSALSLFTKCWNGNPQLNLAELQNFVDQQLGGHALSITLLARLGRAYSLELLQELWDERGTALAQTRNPGHRLDSLAISFSLTENLLIQEPGALDLWQFAALFPEGFDEEVLGLWEKHSGHYQARITMTDFNMLVLEKGCFTMLPPVARYALGYVSDSNSTNRCFNWERARYFAYSYFIELSRNASDTVSCDLNIRSRVKSSQQLWAIEQLFKTDMALGNPHEELARKLIRQLQNVYSFNVLAGLALLKLANQMMSGGMLEKALGDLESRLGNVDLARGHYDNAIELYKKEQAKLGLANVYQSTGDLLLSEKRVEEAILIYQNALQLYQAEQAPIGLAYTLSELIRCHHLLGDLHEDDLRKIAVRGFFEAKRSGIKSVLQYFITALSEFFGNNDESLKRFLSSISSYREE